MRSFLMVAAKICFSGKDTHRKKNTLKWNSSASKQYDIWIVGTSNQLFIRGF